MAERFPIEDEILGRHDERRQPACFKELTKQDELGRQILRHRRLVDDGHAAQRRITAHQPPLVEKHGDEVLLDMMAIGALPFGLRTTRQLRVEQAGIQQTAPGIGIDLDETRPVGVQMKIVAKKDTGRPRIVTGDGRRMGQHTFPPSRQRNNPLNEVDQRRHEIEVGLRDKNTRIRKQMGPRRHDFPVRQIRTALQRALKRRMIDRLAKAPVVQSMRGLTPVLQGILHRHPS